VSSYVLGVPSARKSTITISATAGNVATNKTPGANKRWLLFRGRIILVCDANAANRQIILQLTDGTNVTETLWISGNITAGVTHTCSMGEVRLAPSTGTVGDTSYLGFDILLLHGAAQFRITISAGLAGDSYSGYLEVLETDA